MCFEKFLKVNLMKIKNLVILSIGCFSKHFPRTAFDFENSSSSNIIVILYPAENLQASSDSTINDNSLKAKNSYQTDDITSSVSSLLEISMNN